MVWHPPQHPTLSIVRREAAEGGSPTGPQASQGHAVVVAIDFGTTYRQVQAVSDIANADMHFYMYKD